MSNLSRRDFLKKSGEVSAGLFAAGVLSSCQEGSSKAALAAGGKVGGANERINLGVVGIRGRGWNLADGFMNMANVHIKSLCDVDGNVLEKRIKEVESKKGYRPRGEKDMRKIFDDDDIDAVVIATPNFWHGLGTIWACQAGKHVYVEKPCCHNVWEGRKMVEAARKYDVLVQVGFQNRSIQNVRRAIAFLHKGGIGEVYMARGMCYKPRDPIGMPKDGVGAGPEYKYWAFNQPGKQYDEAYMAKVDYDMWTGPADARAFNYNRFHYNWHWQWNYGNGDIGNQGPHQFDIARWGLGKKEHPVKVSSSGGYFGKASHQETPNTQTANFEYGDGKLMAFEVRGLYTGAEENIKIGNLFYGTKGWMHLNGSTWKTYFGRNNEPGPGSDSPDEQADPMNFAGSGSGGHQGNFIAALRSGKRCDLTCDIEEGFMSTALPLLANISYRVGESLVFDGGKEKFVGNRRADKLLKRRGRGQYKIPNTV
jgi:predicted dehydrogenase